MGRQYGPMLHLCGVTTLLIESGYLLLKVEIRQINGMNIAPWAESEVVEQSKMPYSLAKMTMTGGGPLRDAAVSL